MGDVNGKRVVIRKQDRIDYILSGLCDYWQIEKKELSAYVRDPEKVNRKRIAMQILYDIADCSLKDIVNALDYKIVSQPCIYQHITQIREDISSDTYGNKKLKIDYNRILKHLNL